jgi:hypothetical protein
MMMVLSASSGDEIVGAKLGLPIEAPGAIPIKTTGKIAKFLNFMEFRLGFARIENLAVDAHPPRVSSSEKDLDQNSCMR